MGSFSWSAMAMMIPPSAVWTLRGRLPLREPARLGCALVPGPAQEGGHLVLDGPLDDELGAQVPELAQLLGTADPIEQHPIDGFLDEGARGYPSFHGVVSFGDLQGSPRSLRRPLFYSGVRTRPLQVPRAPERELRSG